MDSRDGRPDGLLSWQWSLYADGHRHRTNLVLHVLTVPLFWAGTVTAFTALFQGAVLAAGVGLLAMVAAVGIQGRGHAGEPTRPVPFRHPLDAVARLFVEQWVTFPRYVLSGGFAKAWRAASSGR
jgi:hypothetical protein